VGRFERVGRIKGLLAVAAALVAAAFVATQAAAHIERASYWPNPAADTSVNPPAGGKVPAFRSLYTALRTRPPGTTRIVCQGRVPSRKRIKKLTRTFRAERRSGASRRELRTLKRKLRLAKRSYGRKVARNASIRRLRRAIARARAHGFKVRPSEATRSLNRRQRTRLRRFNERLLAHCRFHSIQRAVSASRNNDRVVILPGVYTEPRSRAQPANDPKCASLRLLNDRGQPEALSYAYQVKCPNDQNLVAVMGRAPGPRSDPKEPRWDRHGIPNLGRCIRCNLQIQGSGVSADEVVVDAGRVKSGNHGPAEPKKDVGIRADRADGFVLANVTVRHVKEHGIYVLESDGYLLDRFKVFWAEEYGVLTFVEDHGLMQSCEASGSGDSGLYPGSSADTGQQTVEKRRRYSQEIRFCDMHHNVSGYSGTASNAVHIHHNDFYDNTLGFTTDVFTAAGHPGYPQDSDLVERNDFYSNNFNPYLKGSDVKPTIPVPTGTGLWIAGGNNNTIRNNRFWNNWRRGAMLFTVPDSFVCGDNALAAGNHQKGCKEDGTITTSYDNRFRNNVMGRDPRGRRDANGTDFWWDNFANQQYHQPPTTTGNCWFGNAGPNGNASSLTTSPSPLPSNCDLSLGTSGVTQEQELLTCFAAFDEDTPNVGDCPWFTTPKEPK
jgi:parallel beta helix pectate lyase-like protein